MIEKVKLDDICLRLFEDDGVVYPYKIENSAYYRFLKSDDDDIYNEYWNRMKRLGRAKTDFMSSSDYKSFCNTFNYLETPYNNSYIRVKRVGSEIRSWDGCHRLACLKYREQQYVDVEVVTGEFKHNGVSNLVDILEVLDGLSDYVIIKSHEYFPNYYDYNDLDILCKNREVLGKEILDKVDVYRDIGFEVKVHNKGVRKHIDLWPPGSNKLNLRFDLMDTFPYDITLGHRHRSFDVNKEYLDFILDRKTVSHIETPKAFTDKTVDVFVPNRVDDLVLRFFEWTHQPHKDRHINHVKEHFSREIEDEFLTIIDKYSNLDVDKQYLERLFRSIKDN